MQAIGIQTYPQNYDEQSSTKQVELGTIGQDNGGNLYIYSKAMEALSAGHILVDQDPNAATHLSFDTVASNAAAIDEYAIAQVLTITAGDTIVAGEFAGCHCFIDDGTGEGQHAMIKGNTGGAATATVYIYLSAPLSTALDVADSDITIYRQNHVEKAAITSSIQRAVGVAPIAVTANYYFWRQVTGVCPVLMGEGGTKWYGITTGDDTEGEGLAVDSSDTLEVAVMHGQIMIVAPAADALCLARINML